MNRFIGNVKHYIRVRTSGELEKKIKEIQMALKNMEPLFSAKNEWILWYKTHLEDYLKLLKLNRIFPQKYSKIFKKGINQLIKNGELKLKDIKLPLPNEHDFSSFAALNFDCLWTYLLDGFEKNILYDCFPYYMEGPYEYKSVNLEKGDIVIDAGACVGEFAALASVKGCKAYAFEPMPYGFQTYLLKTAEMNPDIIACKYALSDKREDLFFNEQGLSGSSFFNRGKTEANIKVQAIDLDTFVEENQIPRVDFIKADIEGAERYMLAGAKRVLKEFAPKLALCKYHLPDDPLVLRKLILDANPNYIIEERWKKIYAYIPK